MRVSILAAALAVAACAGDAAPNPFNHAAHGGPNGHAGHASRDRAQPEAPTSAPMSDVARSGAPSTVEVRPDGDVRTLARALQLVATHGRITVRPGTYREHGLVIDRPVTIVGSGWPTVDAEGGGQIMTVSANDVTIRGLRLANVGTSYVEDRAAIKVVDASGCVIEDNRIDDAFFGIYLANVTGCRIAGNVLRAEKGTEVSSGNGIHLWSSRDIMIERNDISGHRDGIYFEFVHNTRVADNVSEDNLRYGLHFMYSDVCRYVGNTFRHNGSGVAVMYTKHVEMIGNRFEENWGPASYGLLLKEIADSRLERNTFSRNTTALFADAANRLVATHNDFVNNGWAVKLEASTLDARFSENNFLGNTFDVATNSRQHTSSFDDNYWDEYRGYDLNHDGVGDVPFHPVRLFSLVVQQNQPAIALLRSAFVTLLDGAERVLPALTPETLVDSRPRMRRVSS